jgi:hypothetical protein
MRIDKERSGSNVNMKLKYVSLAVATPILIFLIMIGIFYWQQYQNRNYSLPAIEQIEFYDGSIDLVSVTKVDGNFTIYLGMKNADIRPTTVDSSMIRYNGKLPNATEYAGYEPIPDFDVITLEAGEQKNQRIMLVGGPDSPWQSGMTVQIMLQTMKGNQFIKVLTLP